MKEMLMLFHFQKFEQMEIFSKEQRKNNNMLI
jgi:hypothetical protein